MLLCDIHDDINHLVPENGFKWVPCCTSLCGEDVLGTDSKLFDLYWDVMLVPESLISCFLVLQVKYACLLFPSSFSHSNIFSISYLQVLVSM